MERKTSDPEIKILHYLSAHPRTGVVEISRAIKADRGNVSKKLKKLLDPPKLVESNTRNNRGPWSLTTEGLSEAIRTGVDVRTALKNYWYLDKWIEYLKRIDDILTQDLPNIWEKDRNRVLREIFQGYTQLSSLPFMKRKEKTIPNTLGMVFNEYLEDLVDNKIINKKTRTNLFMALMDAKLNVPFGKMLAMM